ncbi:MAG: energy transducer TonB [Candidatus Melainabacteria bacterium]|nr:energy transducer TonB [Candidatus Melainabacteria bacterium]
MSFTLKFQTSKLVTNLLLLVVFMFLAEPVNGMPPNYWEKEGGPRDQLKPWFRDVQQQIRKQPEFEKLTNGIGDKLVCCTFQLKKNGDIANLRTSCRSGSTRLDQDLSELVRKTAPFKQPPNTLPYEKGVVIRFLDSANKANKADNPIVSLEPFKGWGPGRWE